MVSLISIDTVWTGVARDSCHTQYFMHILAQCWCVLENATSFIIYCELPYIGFLFKNFQRCILKDVLFPKQKQDSAETVMDVWVQHRPSKPIFSPFDLREDPPVPDGPFFTRDLYDKYSLAPNIRELWAFLQRYLNN